MVDPQESKRKVQKVSDEKTGDLDQTKLYTAEKIKEIPCLTNLLHSIQRPREQNTALNKVSLTASQPKLKEI